MPAEPPAQEEPAKPSAEEVPQEPPAPEEPAKPSAGEAPQEAPAPEEPAKPPAPEEPAKDPAEKKPAKYKHADITNTADNKIRGLLDRAGELTDKVLS